MQCLCQVKLATGGSWKDATLTDEHPNTTGVVVTVLGVVVTPAMSDRVRVPSSCPLSLFDAAVDAGYHVLGVPRSDNEPAAQTITIDGIVYAVKKSVTPFVVGVPHQRPAFVAYPGDRPPVEQDGDQHIEGDHDLSGYHLVESLGDALPLLQARDSRGGEARHQGARIATLVRSELVDQGVIEEPEEAEGEDNEPATTYQVMRGWLDGEMMKPHLVAGPFNDLDEAVKACELQGGAVVRDSDGAVLTPEGWVNGATGDLINNPAEDKKQ